MANPLYIQISTNGPFTPMVRVDESTDGDMVISTHYAPKDPLKYTETEKEKVSLDSGLQLILIESLDNVMYNNIVNCDTSKQIWEKIEILCEGTEEVRSNQRRILISRYEGFMAKPKEGITEVFKRFNKLINDLQLYDKYYEAKEVNLNFLIALPDHLEQKISVIRVGRYLSRITLEVLYGTLKTYELEMMQRKSLKAHLGHVVDGSSDLIVNDREESEDEQDDQVSVVQAMEQKNKGPQKQVVLELEEDEYHTLDELDEMDQFMAYLARKFSNIRVKKPRKLKKVKKDKAYLELEAKYESLLKKQSGKAYIAEGKSWDDYDIDDEDEKVGNYALMTFEKGEAFTSKSNVPNLTIIDLNASQYKETVEKLSVEMFHIHTSLVVATEEVSRLTKASEKLGSGKQKMDLLLVELESVKQENEYLKNKLKCANEIETVLREKIEKNEVKLKSFRNASELVGQYHEKNKPCANIAIGLDYDALNNKKKDIGETTPTSKAEKKPMVNQDSKTLIKEMKTEDARKKKKNRNGNIGINNSNNFSYVADAPRKQCQRCGSVNHLIHLCKKVVSKPVEGSYKYNEANANDPYSFCDKFDYIPCNLKMMKSCHKLRIDLKEVQIGSTSKRENAQQSMNSILSETTHSDSAHSVNKNKFEEKAGPLVTFGDNNKGFTMGYVSANLQKKVLFNKEECTFISKKTGEVALKEARKGSLFIADLDSANEDRICCFYTKAYIEQSKLWHNKLSHLNFKAINTLVKKELVRDMPNLEFVQDEVSDACQKGKLKRSSHTSKTVNSISAPLYTWVEIMYSKDETPHIIIEHIKKIEKQVEDQNCVKRLRSDNGTEFSNATLTEFCKYKGIVQELSDSRTLQQNGVVERKNRILVEAATKMLQDA
ncbi:hypothetical protein AgCh_008957 [Apium graveolens]